MHRMPQSGEKTNLKVRSARHGGLQIRRCRNQLEDIGRSLVLQQSSGLKALELVKHVVERAVQLRLGNVEQCDRVACACEKLCLHWDKATAYSIESNKR